MIHEHWMAFLFLCLFFSFGQCLVLFSESFLSPLSLKKKGKKVLWAKKQKLIYEATFLFQGCIIRGATKNLAGKASCPKQVSELYSAPSHAAAKSHFFLFPPSLPPSAPQCLCLQYLLCLEFPSPIPPAKFLPIPRGPATVLLYGTPSSSLQSIYCASVTPLCYPCVMVIGVCVFSPP